MAARVDPDFKRQVDEAINDFRRQVCEGIWTIYGERLNQLRTSVVDMLGHLWVAAAIEHFDARQPRAYRRTGGIATPLIVDFQPDYVHLIDWQRIEVRAEIVLDTLDVLEAHLKNQKTLEEVDPTGKGAFEIRTKYPTIRANGKTQHYSLYPSDLGVRGSMHKQDHEYFLAYIFAGPNAPDQPWVYRALGQPKSQATKRDKTRGLDLINQFLAELGARPVGKVQNEMEIELKASSDLLQLIVVDFREALQNKLKLEFKVDSANVSEFSGLSSASAATHSTNTPYHTDPVKQANWEKLFPQLLQEMNGGK